MIDSTAIDVRHITDDEIPEWTRTWGNGYLRPEVEGAADFMRTTLARDRVIGAFDKDRCVGTYRSSPQVLTVPGGAPVPVSLISKVSVAGTHRRRGLLGRMLGVDLRDALGRGEPIAVLDAAQYQIYGRFGFGPATSMAWFEIDAHRAEVDRRASSTPEGVQIVGAEEYRKLAPDVYEHLRAVLPGAVQRDALWWQEATGQRVGPGASWTEPFYVVHQNTDTGEVDGALCFTAEEAWESMLPQSPLRIRDLFALTSDAERALLRYAVTLDWVSTVHLPYRAPDTLLPYWLGNPRAARITALSDYMWVRILDAGHSLSARTYGVEGDLVLKVADASGYAEGTWFLEGGPHGASCTPTSRSADIALDVRDLGSLFLGDTSATTLAELGGTRELRPGALARADAMFRTGRRPWSPRAWLGSRYQTGAP